MAGPGPAAKRCRFEMSIGRVHFDRRGVCPCCRGQGVEVSGRPGFIRRVDEQPIDRLVKVSSHYYTHTPCLLILPLLCLAAVWRLACTPPCSSGRIAHAPRCPSCSQVTRRKSQPENLRLHFEGGGGVGHSPSTGSRVMEVYCPEIQEVVGVLSVSATPTHTDTCCCLPLWVCPTSGMWLRADPSLLVCPAWLATEQDRADARPGRGGGAGRTDIRREGRD